MQGQGRTFTTDLKQGGKVNLYISVDIYEYDGTEDITDTVTVTCLGHVPTGSGIYDAKAGVQNGYVSQFVASDFVLTALNGDLLSIDGGNTWVETAQLSVADYGYITYWVKSNNNSDTVQISVERISYEFTLNVGTYTHNMIPGKEYTVFLRGTADEAHYVSYILSWNNPDLAVSFGGTSITSGGKIDRYSEYYSLVMVYNGISAADVQFTLTDPYVPNSGNEGNEGAGDGSTLKMGNNAIHVSVENNFCAGTTAVFTAVTAGTYIISPANGEMNADVVISDDFSSESVVMPYVFTLDAGESVEFIVFTTDIMNLTEDTIDLVITKK